MFSVRTESDILFRRQLEQMAQEDATFELLITLTRAAAAKTAKPGWAGATRRIDRQMIDDAFETVARSAGTARAIGAGIDRLKAPERTFERAYVCGGTGFVESIADFLVDIGIDYNEIRTERFGP